MRKYLEIKQLIKELREVVGNDLFRNASDHEIIKALLECAIIQSKKKINI